MIMTTMFYIVISFIVSVESREDSNDLALLKSLLSEQIKAATC